MSTPRVRWATRCRDWVCPISGTLSPGWTWTIGGTISQTLESWPLLIPRETVALIGGGHAFGKTHGACTNGAGPKPVEDPVNPWPGEHHNVHDHDASYCDNVSPSVWPSLSGMCGSGKLGDAFTSGFEFPFTSNPTRWDNEYFVNLEHYQVWNMIFNLIWGRVKLSAVFLMWILSKIFSGRNIWDQAVISNGRCHHQPPSSSSKHHYHHHPHHHHLHHSQHWIRLLVHLLQHLPQISPGLRTSGCSPRKLSIVTIVVVIVVIIIIIIIFIAILNLIVMTSRDVALLEDPIYLSYVQLFASSMLEFDEAFASAWWVKSFWWCWHCWWRLTQPRYKLTTRDMGPHSRCIGPIVPPPQPWQVGHDKTMMITMMTTVQCIFLSSTHFPSLQISWLTLLRRNSGLVQRKKKQPKPVSICSWRWQCGETMTFVDCWVDSHGDARPPSGLEFFRNLRLL